MLGQIPVSSTSSAASEKFFRYGREKLSKAEKKRWIDKYESALVA